MIHPKTGLKGKEREDKERVGQGTKGSPFLERGTLFSDLLSLYGSM